MKVADVRKALELYADDPRYEKVRRHMHPAVEAAAIAVGDNVDDSLLVMVTLAALCAHKSVMVVVVDGSPRHLQAVQRVTNVAEFFEAPVMAWAHSRYTIVNFDSVAAAA